MSLESDILNSGYKTMAVSCIIEYKNKILLLRRNKEPHDKLYCPVGGKVEAFESPKEAVMREVEEETGLKVKDPNLAGIMVETSPTKFNWISFIYYHKLPQKVTLQRMDTVEGHLEWVPWAGIADLPVPETDPPIYKKVREQKPFVYNVEYDMSGSLTSMSNEINDT
ncbi:NUDIX hydrolase [Fodinibius salsisoli]|uniref:NUDIX domain-containing protein n=1 Tax=Fodinibius salsisoli TaxID=2820877 RepID=A0ABT3PL70_9BACT|nr:NUDIX domain-containing protein [Fodinibius salsisoli]MCW9706695.1 NUDIX domain-containing protein [Fodinibius salsisoli]